MRAVEVKCLSSIEYFTKSHRATQRWHLTVVRYWRMHFLSAIPLGPLPAGIYLVLFSERQCP